MRWASAVAGTEAAGYHAGMGQSKHLYVNCAFLSLAGWEKKNLIYGGVLYQVVNVPALPFLPAKVAGNSCSKAPKCTACIDILARREVKQTQCSNPQGDPFSER